jgi:FkbM family methyltransferase
MLSGVRGLLARAETRSPLGSWRARLVALLRRFDPNEIRRHTKINFAPRYLNVDGLFGVRYCVDVNDHVGWNIFLHGHFDCAAIAIAALLNETCPGGVFIDVGANIGSTSIPIAKLGIPVIGIEASVPVLHGLAANVALNSPILYTIINAAISSPAHCKAESYVKIFSPPGNFAASSLFKTWSPSRASFRSELCRTTTLDAIVSWLRLDKITAVKLDIEGAECLALEGFQTTLNRLKPYLIFEWRPEVIARSGIGVGDITALFPAGYRFRAVTEDIVASRIGLTFSDFRPDQICDHVLAIPPQSKADWISAGKAAILL